MGFFLFALSSDEPEVFLPKYSHTAILHDAHFRRVVNEQYAWHKYVFKICVLSAHRLKCQKSVAKIIFLMLKGKGEYIKGGTAN